MAENAHTPVITAAGYRYCVSRTSMGVAWRTRWHPHPTYHQYTHVYTLTARSRGLRSSSCGGRRRKAMYHDE